MIEIRQVETEDERDIVCILDDALMVLNPGKG